MGCEPEPDHMNVWNSSKTEEEQNMMDIRLPPADQTCPLTISQDVLSLIIVLLVGSDSVLSDRVQG